MYLVGVDLEGRDKGPSLWIEWIEAALGGIVNKEPLAVFDISPIPSWPRLIIDSQWRKRTRYNLGEKKRLGGGGGGGKGVPLGM